MGVWCTKHSVVTPFEPLESDLDQSSVSTPRNETFLAKTAWTGSSAIHDKVAQFGLVEVAGTDENGLPIITIIGQKFPSKKVVNHKDVLGYLKFTLDKYVDSDYKIVYFHYGMNDENRPSFAWLKEVYFELDRKYKKNLKCLYIVHPTLTLRTFINLFKPVISVKFGKKIRYVNTLKEIEPGICLDKLPVPEDVLKYDQSLSGKLKVKIETLSDKLQEDEPNRQFGIALETLERKYNTSIPIVMEETIKYLTENGLSAEGLFRRSPAAVALKEIESCYNRGKEVVFNDPHVAAATLKSFLRKLPEPLLTFDFYDQAIPITSLDSENSILELGNCLQKQPKRNLVALKYLMQFLALVDANSDVNKMTSSNLAVVFGPTLMWTKDPAVSLSSIHNINSIIAAILANQERLFDDSLSASTQNSS